jgi:hypothetical protein
MKVLDLNTIIIDGYVRLLENLSPNSKLDLISKLTQSVKTDISDKKNSFKKAFGAFESKHSADELIAEIRDNRSFNRKIESF